MEKILKKNILVPPVLSPWQLNYKAKFQPIVKWPGGKRNILSKILRYTQVTHGRYFEPFFGGGALFFALTPERATLGDMNQDLINFYNQLTQNCEKIIKRVKRLKNDARTYYRIRQSRPSDSFERAVRFLYLNRTCFNGLYRTNRGGNFNVPFGNNGRAVLGNLEESIQAAAKLLRKATIVCQDFEKTCSNAKAGDLVYFDPPYTVAHENNGFLKYNASIFTWADQLRLRNLMVRLSDLDVKIILTNAAHSSIKRLYRDFNIYTMKRKSLLSADSSARRLVRELVITNFD